MAVFISTSIFRELLARIVLVKPNKFAPAYMKNVLFASDDNFLTATSSDSTSMLQVSAPLIEGEALFTLPSSGIAILDQIIGAYGKTEAVSISPHENETEFDWGWWELHPFFGDTAGRITNV